MTALFGLGGIAGYFYFTDNAGNTINPSQHIIGRDHFTKMSHELRIASPATKRLRFVGGLFYQRQTHLIHQDYQVTGLASDTVGQRLPGHALADPAEPRRPGLCGVRRD